MSIKYREMVSGGVLTAIAASLYTVPSLAAGVIHAATVNNPTGSAVTVDIYKVPTGLAADGTTKICSRIVGPGAVLSANEAINHKMQAGTQIYATGAGLTINISGVEYTPDS